MNKKAYNENDIRNIANAIRTKSGTHDTYKVSEMANAIENIPSGGTDISNVKFKIISGSNNASAFVVNDTLPDELRDFNTSELINISYLCNLSTNLTNIDSIKNWNMSKCVSLAYAFYGTGLNDLTAIKDWDTRSVQSFEYAFTNIKPKNPELVPDVIELNWNLDKATNCQYMFGITSSGSISTLLQGKITGLYTTENDTTTSCNLNNLFRYQKYLKYVDFKNVKKL